MKTPVALFDMDGTLCDYVGSMNQELAKLRSPDEQVIDPFSVINDSQYQFLWNRMDLIKSNEAWWANLPKLKLGFDVFEMAKDLGYSCEILTQGPRNNPPAFAGKLKWVRNNIDDEIDVTMTRNKSSYYGRVLVDDFPGFVNPWLHYRQNGLVIMPVNKYNADYDHPRVIKYDGTNSNEVLVGLKQALER